MRLTESEIQIICNAAHVFYGDECNVYLFGSRTSDELKGGDIDLFIQSNDASKLSLKNKIHFLVEVKSKIGDQRIDVVYDKESTKAKTAFYDSIQRSCISLNHYHSVT
jgi:predicted nucleotidyltransferase